MTIVAQLFPLQTAWWAAPRSCCPVRPVTCWGLAAACWGCWGHTGLVAREALCSGAVVVRAAAAGVHARPGRSTVLQQALRRDATPCCATGGYHRHDHHGVATTDRCVYINGVEVLQRAAVGMATGIVTMVGTGARPDVRIAGSGSPSPKGGGGGRTQLRSLPRMPACPASARPLPWEAMTRARTRESGAGRGAIAPRAQARARARAPAALRRQRDRPPSPSSSLRFSVLTMASGPLTRRLSRSSASALHRLAASARPTTRGRGP